MRLLNFQLRYLKKSFYCSKASVQFERERDAFPYVCTYRIKRHSPLKMSRYLFNIAAYTAKIAIFWMNIEQN